MLAYVDMYKNTHCLSSRGEVLTLALELLRERELLEGYRALAEEMAQHPDPLVDSGLDETMNYLDEEK